MSIVLSKPGVDDLASAIDALRDWQHEGTPIQLHPGDIGWFWRFGADATAQAIRIWSRDGQIVALGLLDGPDTLRMTIAPDARSDEALARQIIADINDPQRGVLPAGEATVEAPPDAMIHDLLAETCWGTGESWTSMSRDLSSPVDVPDVRIDVVGPELASDHVDVIHAAFERSTFTTERWHNMAAGLPYADAHCLVIYDEHGHAAGAVTVWSAGPGRPGLLEPMGVHPDRRRRGFGKATNLAAAAALREMGCTSATLNTPTANTGAIAAYQSAGYQPHPPVRDSHRPH